MPVKPKRFKNPWVFYFMENIGKAQADNPGKSASKLLQLLSARWQALDEEAQKKYLKLSEDDRNRYLEETEAFKANLTPENELAISEEKARIQLKKTHAMEKKKLKALGIPKRPPNAYILFSMDFMKKKKLESAEGDKFDVRGTAFLVGEAWSKLSAQEKAKWEEEAGSKMKEYKKNIEKWESEMSSKGYLEIVDSGKT